MELGHILLMFMLRKIITRDKTEVEIIEMAMATKMIKMIEIRQEGRGILEKMRL